jgi:hypothetical protein
MDEKPLVFDEAWLDRIAAGAPYYGDSQDELIRLARLGLKLSSQKNPGCDATCQNYCTHDDAEVSRLTALGEWAEKHAIPALKWEDKRCGKVFGPLGEALAALDAYVTRVREGGQG